MAIRYETPRPEIKVFYSGNKGLENIVEQITLGIEEEGIPFVVEERKDQTDPTYLAYKAAESSRLGVGIGVGESIVLHFIKLNQDQPLFTIPVTTDQEKLRKIGANGARLIKGNPFKDF